MGQSPVARLAPFPANRRDRLLAARNVQVRYDDTRSFPRERERLYRLVASTGAQGVVFLSGDRHIGALYREAHGVPYPLYEMTSSGVTHTWAQAVEAGPNRLGALFTDLHYGMVEIDWEARALRLAIKDLGGTARRSQSIAFNELKART